MKRVFLFAGATVFALVSFGLRQAVQKPTANAPVYSPDNRLIRPENYREWVWLSSGLGMSYNPTTAKNLSFDNVFVTPEAYRSFLQTGTWPDKTMFILEGRSAETNGSINQQGHFQGHLMGMEAEVKDESRFPGKWGFFAFENTEKWPRYSPATSAKPLVPPESDTCHSCHSQNGAVDNTFVQFYPTLLEIAKEKGTLKNSQEIPVSTSAPKP